MTALSTEELYPTRMTSEQFLQLGEDPPGIRLELAHGVIAMSPSPTPRHSKVCINLVAILEPHIEERSLGELYLDLDTVFDTANTRRPDLLFVRAERVKLVGEKAVMGAPDLCVEVVSPGSVRIDRGDKFDLFERRGVPWYWLLDPGRRLAEAFELKEGGYQLSASGREDEVVKFGPFLELEIPLKRVWRGTERLRE